MFGKIFSFIVSKLGSTVVGGVTGGILRTVLITSLAGGGIFLGGFAWLKIHDAKVYNKAYIEAFAKCPPQSLYTGNPTVNNFAPSKMNCLPLPLGKHWGLGLCHNS